MLNSGESFSEIDLLRLFRGICLGVNHLHTLQIPLSHRDLKLDNVLLSAENVPVIMDFGSTRPARVEITSRKEALELQEWASIHCTMFVPVCTVLIETLVSIVLQSYLMFPANV